MHARYSVYFIFSVYSLLPLLAVKLSGWGRETRRLCQQKTTSPLLLAIDPPAQKTLCIFFVISPTVILLEKGKEFSGLERNTACRARRRG